MKDRNLKNHDDWATPEDFYKELDNEFNFDFDPCPLFADFDGLQIEWGERNLVNPPYSRGLKDKFVMKAIEEAHKGKLCVLILPVATSSVLYHQHIHTNAEEIRFVKGRLKFTGLNSFGEKVSTKAGMFDSKVVVLKKGGMKNAA